VLEYAHQLVREEVSFAEEDRIFANDINSIKAIIADFSFVKKITGFAAEKGLKLNQDFAPFNLNAE